MWKSKSKSHISEEASILHPLYRHMFFEPPRTRLRICSRPREKKLHGSNLLNVDAQMLSSLCHKAQVPDCLAPISGCPISQRVLSLPVPPSALTLKTSYRARLTLMILFRRCDVPIPYLHVVWEMKRTWGRLFKHHAVLVYSTQMRAH